MDLKELYLKKVTAMSQDAYTKSEAVNGYDKLSEQMFDISNSILSIFTKLTKSV